MSNNYFTDISNDDLPQFARLVYRNDFATDNAKKRFTDLVLRPYLTDSNKKEEWEGIYVYFVKGELYAMCGDNLKRDFPQANDFKGVDITCVRIEKNPPEYYLM